MTEREDFDLQGSSAAQRSGEKRAESGQNLGRREPAQVSHFQLRPSLRDGQNLRSTVLYAPSDFFQLIENAGSQVYYRNERRKAAAQTCTL